MREGLVFLKAEMREAPRLESSSRELLLVSPAVIFILYPVTIASIGCWITERFFLVPASSVGQIGYLGSSLGLQALFALA